MSGSLKEKIIREIHFLPDPFLKQIKKLIDEFKKQNHNGNQNPTPSATGSGVKGRFDDLCGSISKEDAEEMRRAIDDCRRVNNENQPPPPSSTSARLKGRFDDLFGSISEEDAEEMMKAIEDCRRIDEDAW